MRKSLFRALSLVMAMLLMTGMAVLPQTASAKTSVNVGDSIYFGRTEQDNNLNNGTERIEWIVLAVNGDKALVMTRYGVVGAQFTTHSSGQTWANCTLREYLNGAWYYDSFTYSERNAISSTTVTDSRSDWDPERLPNNRNTRSTTDYIFVLSYGEIMQYLPSSNRRLCAPTAYVVARGGNQSNTRYGGMKTCWYWLRNPAYRNNAGAVDWDGSIATCYMNHTYGVARPCCWVSLSALGY